MYLFFTDSILREQENTHVKESYFVFIIYP